MCNNLLIELRGERSIGVEGESIEGLLRRLRGESSRLLEALLLLLKESRVKSLLLRLTPLLLKEGLTLLDELLTLDESGVNLTLLLLGLDESRVNLALLKAASGSGLL